MRLSFAVAGCVALSLLVGCGPPGLTSAGKAVTPVDAPPSGKCKKIGSLKAKAEGYGPEDDARGAMNQIRNQAAQSKATHVQTTKSSQKGDVATIEAVAFKCK